MAETPKSAYAIADEARAKSDATVTLRYEHQHPPKADIPSPPRGFVPVDIRAYRGFHPKAGQLNALPLVIQELRNNPDYAKVFGIAAPGVETLVEELTIASEWSTMRSRTEAFLEYVKTFEAVAWKATLTDLQAVSALFNVLEKQNKRVASSFPELAKLLDVPKAIGKRSAATRLRKAKSKVAAETPKEPNS